MALSKDKKAEVVAELEQLFADSKLTVVAKYQGMTVKSMQQLRRDARDNGSVIKVVKNRLVRKAIENVDAIKGTDTTDLKDMLMYVFNADDETAGAQVLAAFAKKDDAVQFVGGITADGQFMDASQIKALASLPSKQQLIAGVINTLQSPLRTVTGQLNSNLLGLMDALALKASN
jgi:large subunit ribosomal protein L10